MDRERKVCSLGGPCNHFAKTSRAHGGQTLGQKDVSRFWLLSLQSPQRTYLDAAHRMHARHAALDAVDMQEPLIKVYLILPQRADLRCPQSVPVSRQDHGCVAVAVAAAVARGRQEQV